jgi:NitT/TauT family transport system permease protein
MLDARPIERQPDVEVELPDVPAEIAHLGRRLPLWRRLLAVALFRRAIVVALIAILWEVYARWLDNPLLLPTCSDAFAALWAATLHGVLPARLAASLRVLSAGYLLGVGAATVLVTAAALSRFGGDVLGTLTAMLNPLPAIALLPVALIWFGLGPGSLIFVLTHSVLWAVALNAHAGFLGVPDAQRMAARNAGLRGVRFVAKVLIPSAFPSILTGLRVGWAFAWRTLIAAELVFGVTSHSGGLGWFIYESRMEMDTPSVFAGLLAIILIGLFFEGVVFRAIESVTIQRWGMHHA